MKPTHAMHDLGQSLWLDNITRDLLDDGTLRRYVDDWSVTGLTSNPTIFEQALKNSRAYDASIATRVARGERGEALFFALAIEDLARAADVFAPVHQRTAGVDGYVSLEVSPLLAASGQGSRGSSPTNGPGVPMTGSGSPTTTSAPTPRRSTASSPPVSPATPRSRRPRWLRTRSSPT